MPQEVRGVVARSKGAPVSVETIVLPDPGPHEVVVQVETVGEAITTVAPGGLPTRDFPLLIDLFLQGRFALEDVEKAFARMDRGEVLRSVVVL